MKLFSRPSETLPQLALASAEEKTNYAFFQLSQPIHESTTENPRALPDISLVDLCDIKNNLLAEKPFTTTGVLWIAIYSNNVRHEAHISISLSPEELLSIAAIGDIILLSDHRADHYMRIDRIEADKIFLSDPWPALLPIRRVQRKNGLLYLTKNDFFRYTVGILTLDTPRLLAAYLHFKPTLWNDYQTLFTFGNILLRRNSLNLAPLASMYLGKAFYLAYSLNAPEKDDIVARQYLALMEAAQLRQMQPELSIPIHDPNELANIIQHCGLDLIASKLTSEYLKRAINVTTQLGLYDIAQHHADFL